MRFLLSTLFVLALATPLAADARVAVSGISTLKSMWSAMSDAQSEYDELVKKVYIPIFE